MSSAFRIRLYIVLTVLMMAFIFFQSALPADVSSKESDFLVPQISKLLNVEPDTASTLIRKTAHLLEYLVLGILMSLTAGEILAKHSVKLRHSRLLRILIPFGAGALYAVSDEIHQLFVPGRSGQFLDVGLDCFGVAAGVFIIFVIQRRKHELHLHDKT